MCTARPPATAAVEDFYGDAPCAAPGAAGTAGKDLLRKTLEKYRGHDPAAIDAVLAGAPANVDELPDWDRLMWEERMMTALCAAPRPFDEETARSTMSYRAQRGCGGRSSPRDIRRQADLYARHYKVRTYIPYEVLYAQELAGALLAMEDDGLPLPMPLPRLLVRDRQRRQS